MVGVEVQVAVGVGDGVKVGVSVDVGEGVIVGVCVGGIEYVISSLGLRLAVPSSFDEYVMIPLGPSE